MRFMVFIPAFILFLSNIPFIHEMPMEAKMGMMKEGKSCSMQMGEPVERYCMAGNMPGKSGETAKGCCNRTETTSTCICLFTFTAPVQEIKTFQLRAIDDISCMTGYVQLKWKDPDIASPGRPPDHC